MDTKNINGLSEIGEYLRKFTDMKKSVGVDYKVWRK